MEGTSVRLSEDSVYRTDEKMRSHDKNERSERVGGGVGWGQRVSVCRLWIRRYISLLSANTSDECSLFVGMTIWTFVTCVLKTAQ